MGTTIKALGTFRNDTRLPNGIVRRGRTVEVSDSYAEELVETGKAEYVDADSGADSEGDSGEPDTSDTAPESWESDELPEDTPKRSLLIENEVQTLGALVHMAQNGTLGNIKGIGPATVDKLNAFIEEVAP